ncbi:putative disease resistance protein RGA3 [Chenopodium quinoa]|uniref:putative disease resistance protein RGA3 n=1 Tax=Chenopodium quinoa TaxID=63459 RepID=UPI000B7964BB|nr:putative disease resistance protein RGA3 [Chenopodium quinoa]
MAEGVISGLLVNALTNLGKSAVKEAASCWGARDDLEKLEDTLKVIRARVRDAERHQEEERSDTFKEWLRRLRVVLYQADDMFDDVLTVDRQKQRIDVNKQVCVSFSRSGKNLRFDWKISRQIKSIRQQLDKINSDIGIANLKLNVYHGDEPQPLRARYVRNRERGSHVREDDVIGRENDKKIITEMLFDDDGKRVSVISIVGFGGLGKTTLAQLVYNDENVRKHFDLAAWACVPEVNNQNQVLRTVCQSLGFKDTRELSVDQIESSNQASLKDKKFLLVLDDIWDDERNNWLDLLRLLECGADGSKVIATTRSAKVANAVGSTETYNLGLLTDKESWSLFKKYAFKLGQEESNHTLTQLGKEIVDSCGKVPLAIRVVGSLCYSETREEGWRRIRNARLSKAKGKEDDNIMQVLKTTFMKRIF